MHNATHPHDRLRGIGFMIAAVCVFSVMDALLKRLSNHYKPLEIACLRSLSSWVCLLPAITWQRSWASLKPSGPGLHALRGVLAITLLASFVFAVHTAAAAAALAINDWQAIERGEWLWPGALPQSAARPP